MNTIKVNKIEIGNDKPFVLIAGLNVLEDEKTIESVITKCIESTSKHNIPYIFKASYDKANRSSIDSYRGPGAIKGLQILRELKQDFDVPVISDIHTPKEAELASDVLDIIQIPAFLSRQTDLIEAACETSLPLNIKKGQFLAPSDMLNILKKCSFFKNERVMICERGTSFGYNNLIVDMLGMVELKKTQSPIIFDVTHSLQRPGALGDKADGRGSNALELARSGMSLGLAGLFLETHPNPEKALCDGPCALKLDQLDNFLDQIKTLDDLIKSFV
jgi:2-dehydro-3-deoxyphosphooctonate aldolase (KDO 8-P synthase)|tara:strand:+ start:1464 stop:2288 length:825 start_codon:yes stop_codon:yes gene_type:complete